LTTLGVSKSACSRRIAEPFEWKFTRRDLDRLLDRLDRVDEDHARQAA
jgi:hypothetical protein